MTLWESIKLALRSIRRNVLRSILTLLGIVIGVAAVIALVTIGQGATERVTADLSKLGSNLLVVRPGSGMAVGPASPESRTFQMKDVDPLRSIPGIRSLTATHQRTVAVSYGGTTLQAPVTGGETSFFDTYDWIFADGRGFSEQEYRSGAAVCVIGNTLVQNLVRQRDTVGEVLRVGEVSCEVIGVLRAKGNSAFGQDQDLTVIMPLRTLQRRIPGGNRISMIAVSADSPESVSAVQASVAESLRQSRRVAPDAEDDFSVRDMTQLAQTFSSTTQVMTGLLGAVAAVSLLVGGIGIMNIMLVSVAERTREIGIRLAIGALGNQVLTQFLVEAIVLCVIGGIIGVALGVGLAFAGSIALEIPFSVNPGVAFGAVAFSGLIGVVFGYFPARRAAMLDPIEALRHE